ncbi:MAG: glycosyltransferase family 4 protein [Candidatus Nealsonbacteria bacterium]|nr:glycosyltransferase family 4 protein [Candidatus Nealsonbacteria bacterium]
MTMKITYIINARIPTEKAHGIHVMKMCEALAKKCQVELVVSRRFNKIKQNPFDYYGVPRVFTIKKIPCIDLIPLDKYLGNLALWIESFSFTFVVFFYLLFNKADIIYTRDKFLLFISPFWRNFVFEIHTFPKRYFIYARFFKRLKNLIVITEKLKNLFAGQGMSPQKILVAPDGVDIEMFKLPNIGMFEAREKLKLPQDKKIALYTGHLYEWKGVSTLAEAARYLPDNIEIYFVGGTDEDIEKFKNKYLYIRNVRVVGHRPYAEIPFWLRAADVLVIPNSGKEEISKHWTSPLKMFEYMASKTPIVASDLPSIREILNESNAVLFIPDNSESLAAGIIKILQNPRNSDIISSSALEDVKSYSWDKRAEKICQKLF